LTKSTRTTKELHCAHQVTNLAPQHQETMSLMETNGFPRSSFVQGKLLYEAPVKSAGAEIALEDELPALKDHLRQRRGIIAVHYPRQPVVVVDDHSLNQRPASPNSM
jgi:hypothetical protein